MEKCIYNEQNRFWYELQGDYYLPCLKLPEEKAVSQSALLQSVDKRQTERLSR